jgi:hypothetical protein
MRSGTHTHTPTLRLKQQTGSSPTQATTRIGITLLQTAIKHYSTTKIGSMTKAMRHIKYEKSAETEYEVLLVNCHTVMLTDCTLRRIVLKHGGCVGVGM